ncbi:MAG: hypothetical protein AB4080_14575, partial [Trichodesmium sp.]
MSKFLFSCLLFVLSKALIFSVAAQANEIKYTPVNDELKTLEKDTSTSKITPVAEDAIIVKPNQLEQNTDS